MAVRVGVEKEDGVLGIPSALDLERVVGWSLGYPVLWGRMGRILGLRIQLFLNLCFMGD